MNDEIGKRRHDHDFTAFLAQLLVCAMWDGVLPGGAEPWTRTAEGVFGVSIGMLSKAVGMPYDDMLSLAQEHAVTVYDGIPSDEWRRMTGAPSHAMLPSVSVRESPFIYAYLSDEYAPNEGFEKARSLLRDLAYEVIISGCKVAPFSETAWRHIEHEQMKRKAGEIQ